MDTMSPRRMQMNSQVDINEACLTVAEVAGVLRISRGAAYEAIRSGALPGAIRIGRTIRVPKSAVAQLLAAPTPAAAGTLGSNGRTDR